MLGRIHLSGHLDQMSRAQRGLVAEAVGSTRSSAASLAGALPFWPLGLPRWTDPWIALGLRAPDASYLTVWRRGPFDAETGTLAEGRTGTGTGTGTRPDITLPVPHLRGRRVNAELLYPRSTGAAAGATWDAAASALSVQLPRVPSACLIRLGAQ